MQTLSPSNGGRSPSFYIQRQTRVMLRWMRRYRLTEWDWVQLAAERYYRRHQREANYA